ncbi:MULTISPECIES: C40 family peptidase [unclassified Meridianimarinicoccus]|uniref:C40 family peptidase n=1 Tax=unclassified Meridianimarinicoccus TaxID=2923344 RepID=UPI001868D850|nr:C40 family peptidase [Fluviibacterium sp. MJW13]
MTQPARPALKTFQVAVPVADLLDRPGGTRSRQLLYGEAVQPLAEADGHILVRRVADGYRGAMRPEDLSQPVEPTHQVITLATHLYAAPDFKAPDVASLSFGARLTLTGTEGSFGQTHEGLYVPMVHVAKAHLRFSDPASIAELFLGTPYLWGGNSRLGLDCSGLVQVACLACGLSCPGDSGEQARTAGQAVADAEPLQRNDLLFWKGHVALAVSDDRLIHANAHHMSVVYESAEEAVRRIAGQGDGPVTSRRRLVPAN